MQRSKIEYLRGPDGKEGFTWNPVRMKCTPVSAGCARCWHLRFAKRHAANPTFNDRARNAYAGGYPFFDNDEWMEPAKLRKPAKIAVQLMGDLFHDDVPTDYIDRIFYTMLREERHTFLVLTKRAGRMQHYIRARRSCPDHIWLGVSVEDQKAADERIPLLLQTPAAVRWVSVEPMLEAVDLEQCKAIAWNPGVNFVVVGAETGPGKRPCRPEWIDDLRQQCKAAGVAFFGKVGEDGQPLGPREYPEAP